MDKIRRNERMSVMMKKLSGAPGRMYTLSQFLRAVRFGQVHDQ